MAGLEKGFMSSNLPCSSGPIKGRRKRGKEEDVNGRGALRRRSDSNGRESTRRRSMDS